MGFIYALKYAHILLYLFRNNFYKEVKRNHIQRHYAQVKKICIYISV